jgi:hypothetical protein
MPAQAAQALLLRLPQLVPAVMAAQAEQLI